MGSGDYSWYQGYLSCRPKSSVVMAHHQIQNGTFDYAVTARAGNTTSSEYTPGTKSTQMLDMTPCTEQANTSNHSIIMSIHTSAEMTSFASPSNNFGVTGFTS